MWALINNGSPMTSPHSPFLNGYGLNGVFPLEWGKLECSHQLQCPCSSLYKTVYTRQRKPPALDGGGSGHCVGSFGGTLSRRQVSISLSYCVIV